MINLKKCSASDQQNTFPFKLVYFPEQYPLLKSVAHSNSNFCFWKLCVGVLGFFPSSFSSLSLAQSIYRLKEKNKAGCN